MDTDSMLYKECIWWSSVNGSLGICNNVATKASVSTRLIFGKSTPYDVNTYATFIRGDFGCKYFEQKE